MAENKNHWATRVVALGALALATAACSEASSDETATGEDAAVTSTTDDGADASDADADAESEAGGSDGDGDGSSVSDDGENAESTGTDDGTDGSGGGSATTPPGRDEGPFPGEPFINRVASDNCPSGAVGSGEYVISDVTADDVLNFRVDPDPSSEILAGFPDGTTVQSIEPSATEVGTQTWLLMVVPDLDGSAPDTTYGNGCAWVNDAYLTFTGVGS